MARYLVPGKLEVIIGSFIRDEWIKFAQILQSISSARLKFIDPHPIADANYWFRTELRDFIGDVLLDSETLARPYFNQRCIAELVRGHMIGKKNLADILVALVTFEFWHRMFSNK